MSVWKVLRVILWVALLLSAWVAWRQSWYASSFTGQVVDEQNQPVQGAVVLVTWQARSIFEGARGPSIAVAETQTDATGAFRLPGGWGFHGLTRFMRCDEPTIRVLHDQYLPEAVGAGKCVGLYQRNARIDWAPENPVIRMTRLDSAAVDENRQDRAMSDLMISMLGDHPAGDGQWMRAPMFKAASQRMEAMDRQIRARRPRIPPASFRWQGPTQVVPGSELDVEVVVQSEVPARSASMTIKFDPRALQVIEVTAGDYLKKDGGKVDLAPMIDLDLGQIRMVAQADPPAGPSEGVLVRLKLRALGGTEQTRLFFDGDLHDSKRHLIPVHWPSAYELTIKR